MQTTNRNINVENWLGGVPRGADATAPVQAAFDFWAQQQDVVTPGNRYALGEIHMPSDPGLRIDGTIKPNFAAGVETGKICGNECHVFGDSDYWLHIDGRGSRDFIKKIIVSEVTSKDAGIRASADQKMHNIVFDNCRVSEAREHGIWIDGPFESQLNSCALACIDDKSGHALHIFPDGNDQGGQNTSIDVIGCTLTRGIHGIYSKTTDLFVSGGGSYLSGKEGIFAERCAGRGIYAHHVESCHQDGTGGVNSKGAAIYYSGIGHLSGNFHGTGSTFTESRLYYISNFVPENGEGRMVQVTHGINAAAGSAIKELAYIQTGAGCHVSLDGVSPNFGSFTGSNTDPGVYTHFGAGVVHVN